MMLDYRNMTYVADSTDRYFMVVIIILIRKKYNGNKLCAKKFVSEIFYSFLNCSNKHDEQQAL
jgi:hypothetical protein